MICEVLVPRVPVPSVLPLLRSDSRSLTSLPIDLATRSLSFFLACLVTPELGTVPWNVTSRDERTGVWMSHPLSRGCVKRDVPTKQRATTLLLGQLQTLQNLRGPRMESGWHNVTKASPKKKTHEGLQTRILNPFCIGWQRGRILADRTGESTWNGENTKGLTCQLLQDSIKQLSWQPCQVTSDRSRVRTKTAKKGSLTNLLPGVRIAKERNLKFYQIFKTSENSAVSKTVGVFSLVSHGPAA